MLTQHPPRPSGLADLQWGAQLFFLPHITACRRDGQKNRFSTSERLVPIANYIRPINNCLSQSCAIFRKAANAIWLQIYGFCGKVARKSCAKWRSRHTSIHFLCQTWSLSNMFMIVDCCMCIYTITWGRQWIEDKTWWMKKGLEFL